jgi:hypothetical protein
MKWGIAVILVVLLAVLTRVGSSDGDVDYGALDDLLSTVVVGGGVVEKDGTPLNAVDYRGLRRAPQQLHAFTASVAGADLAAVAAAGQNASLAFWVDTYNALVLDTVLRQPCKAAFGRFCWPARSLHDLGGWFESVWARRRYTVGGASMSLDDVESRARALGDPRVHAALVCAAVSCPNLGSSAFVPALADTQLEAAAQAFVDDRHKGVRWSNASRVVHVSRIFDWFSDDFQLRYPGYADPVVQFLLDHTADPALRDYLAANRLELMLAYLDYDWTFNDLRLARPCAGTACAPPNVLASPAAALIPFALLLSLLG